MSYLALARKWRPLKFVDLIGQDFIVKALQSSLSNNRLHHAYLFSGTRGVGKTTIARIFAKSLNCKRGVTANACGVCDSCVAIDNGSNVDVIEVDAASRRTVEQTATLLDNISYKPSFCSYKIYIIDEVHMFSRHSFNALLKTLEEPPEHIKFLLATTDPRKLPITILSRTLQFNLKAVRVKDIKAHMVKILTNEKIDFEENALVLIANAASGSVRDALSLLDQGISFCNGAVRTDEIIVMLGVVSTDSIFNILENIIKNKKNEAFDIVEKICQQHSDSVVVVDEILTVLYAISLYQGTKIIKESQQENKIKKIASLASPEHIQLLYQIASCGKADIKNAPDDTLGLQMIILRMLCFSPHTNNTIKQPNTNDNTNESASVKSAPTKTTNTQTASTLPVVDVKQTNDDTVSLTDINWHNLITNIPLNGFSKQLALNCSLVNVTGNQLNLELSPDNAFLLKDKNKQILQDFLNSRITEDVIINIKIKQPTNLTPQEQQTATINEERKHRQQEFISQPIVQSVQKEFGVNIDIDSVK
jgi:DNA polymerase III subunit gamma/tau